MRGKRAKEIRRFLKDAMGIDVNKTKRFYRQTKKQYHK